MRACLTNADLADMAPLGPGGVSPWIETLVLNYDDSRSNSCIGSLRAFVAGMGPVSKSQFKATGDSPWFLMLSDGVLRIPAFLSAKAWEQLQNEEDCELFSSLLNTRLSIREYRVQFHMSTEKKNSRFVLFIGDLAIDGAGEVTHHSLSCMTVPSIRRKILETLEAVQDQKMSSQQCPLDPSDLLLEWQLQDVLEDVQWRVELAGSQPVTTQPSSSSHTSVQSQPGAASTTCWDMDRVIFRRETGFSVPITCLLVPEGDVQRLQTPSSLQSAASDPREHFILHEDMDTEIFDINNKILSNPWDIFPPPHVTASSSSDASPEASPKVTPTNNPPDSAKSTPDHATNSSSMQPLHRLTKSQLTSEHSRGELSYLPPNQWPHSPGLTATACSLASASVSAPHLSSAPGQHRAYTTQLSDLDQERENLEELTVETTERRSRKAKEKTHASTQRTFSSLVEEQKEEAQISGGPPSWLLDSQAASDAEETSSHREGGAAASCLSKAPTVHSNGRLFSYSYQVSEQNLQDFSQFRVAESLLLWAVKYLVPKMTEDPCSVSVTQDMMEDT